MYGNVKEDNNANLKGEIGEAIAQHHFNTALRTKQYHHNVLKRFNLTLEQSNFLIQNWTSFDLIDLETLTIYEVKTRKFFNRKLRGLKNRIVITPNFGELCEKAKVLGFEIKLIEITLFDNWKYGLLIKDFDSNHFWVHNPRPSGWERQKKNQEHYSNNL